MADSDDDYIQDARFGTPASDDELSDVGIDARRGTQAQSKSRRNAGQDKSGKGKKKATGQARWEASAQNLGLTEGVDGGIAGALERDLEATKRARLKKNTTPTQRGIIRHLILVLDLSEAMAEKDFKPNRYTFVLRSTLSYIREFFEQNPISQLALVGMKDGLAKPISDLSGNPNLHLSAVRALMQKEGQGNPSLQNALEMSCAMLQGAPSHGTREVVIVLGALLTNDPGDIYTTIRRCAKERLRVGIVGLAARLHICGEIVSRTNGGDDSGYGVAVDEFGLKDLLMATTTPPEIRGEGMQGPSALASLLKMGFPNRIAEEVPISWQRAEEVGSVECRGCLSKFPEIPTKKQLDKDGDTTMAEASGNTTKGANQRTAKEQPQGKGEGASESRRYECETCQNHFCVDCDVFCHDVLHNCPGCQSQVHLPGAQRRGTAADEPDEGDNT
ncbi:MAG: hypothetical protein Q9165_000222 [Trypethelium subeluteriae]